MASDDETAPTRSSEEKESKPNLEESPSTPFPEYSHDTSPSEKTPESPSPKLPESEVHFAFGPGDHYWIRCGSRWRIVRSKTASNWSELKIHTPFWAAFKHENGTFVGGDDEDGKGRVVHSWNNSYMVKAEDVEASAKARAAYFKLHEWIGKCVGFDAENVKKVSLTIGPKGSYFARYESSQMTHELPEDTQASIDNSESPPRQVALGIKGAWVALYEDGSREWNLRHAYPGLSSTDILTNDANKVVFVALNPYREDAFLTVLEDGNCNYNGFFDDRQEAWQSRKMLDTYMRSRARRDGTTFSHSLFVNGSVYKEVRITPDSNAEETTTDAFMARWRARRECIGGKDLVYAGVVAGGVGTLTKIMGFPTTRAFSLGGCAGLGFVAQTLVNGRTR